MCEEKYRECLAELCNTARLYGGKINYWIVADMMKDNVSDFREEDLTRAIKDLLDGGFLVEEADEGYIADSVPPNTFIPADVRISSQTLAVWNLLERLEYDEINLQPDFQRKSGLWDLEKQSRLIESLMLKIPLPAFYFDASNEDRWNVIDGLQRLTAFQNLLLKPGNSAARDKAQPQKLSGLQYMSQFNGCTFEELPRQYQRRIREAQIVIYTVDKGTPSEIVFNIFQRINTGGLRLEDQEIRNAIYQGKSTELTKRLAQSKEFLEATQHAVPGERMMDREYVTRYLAFTELSLEEYKENIDTFLGKAMKTVNQYPDEEIEKIERTFKQTMRVCHSLFGIYAFRTFRENGRRGTINKALFELWSICLHTLTEQQTASLLRQKEAFMKDFEKLLNEHLFRSALRGGELSAVRKRVALGKELVGKYI